jgi:hypothetical protein
MRQSKQFKKWFKQYGFQLPDMIRINTGIYYISRPIDLIKRIKSIIEDLENRAYRRGFKDGLNKCYINQSLPSKEIK